MTVNLKCLLVCLDTFTEILILLIKMHRVHIEGTTSTIVPQNVK